jgi:short-subunit dehydrogenase
MANHGTALVTGASAGIGRAFARRLAHLGHDMVVTGRRGDRLEELAGELRRDAGVAVDVVVADLAEPAGIGALEERVAGDERLALVVNNAGFGAYGPFEELGPETARGLLSVHVGATVRLTMAALPGMVARGTGSIVNMASLLAFSGLLPAPPLPFRATYAASKSFVITFSQLLAGELVGTGVRVIACCPGVTTSEFHDIQGMDVSAVPQMAADDVVTAALTGLELGEIVCAPGLEDSAMLDEVFQAQLKVVLAAAGPAATGTLASRYSATQS